MNYQSARKLPQKTSIDVLPSTPGLKTVKLYHECCYSLTIRLISQHPFQGIILAYRMMEFLFCRILPYISCKLLYM